MDLLNKLRKSLFWDIDLEDLDVEEDADFVIGRVLDYGNLKEWKEIKSFYGVTKIKKVTKSHLFSSPRSANFWAFILDINLKDIKRTKNPSLKIPRAFLTR